MKKSNLKSYNSYKEQHVKENFLSSYNPNENLEDIKENDEVVETSEHGENCDCEECSPKHDENCVCPECSATEPLALGTEEEKKIDAPVIAHVEIQTELEIEPATPAIELPTPAICPEPPQINNQFNPAESGIQADLAPKIFSIVRIMTQNGEKIGMCYTEEVGEYGTPIHNNIDFKSACELVKQCCSECGVDEYRNDFDTIIGTIPSFMIPKKNKGLGNTSYRPN
jgi:hypothetical protein